MKTKLFVVLALAVIFATSLFASQRTVTGVLTDDMCTKKHMMPGKANADCVRDCIKHGAKYVVVSQGKVLELRGDQKNLAEFAGRKVTLTGELKGNVLTFTDAKLAE
jgi:hypothetical protein